MSIIYILTWKLLNYCWWFRNPTRVEMIRSLSYYLQLFIHPKWLALGFLSSTVAFSDPWSFQITPKPHDSSSGSWGDLGVCCLFCWVTVYFMKDSSRSKKIALLIEDSIQATSVILPISKHQNWQTHGHVHDPETRYIPRNSTWPCSPWEKV